MPCLELRHELVETLLFDGLLALQAHRIESGLVTGFGGL